MPIVYNTQQYPQGQRQRVTPPQKQPVNIIQPMANKLEQRAAELNEISKLSKTLQASIKPTLDVAQEYKKQKDLKKKYDEITSGIGTKYFEESDRILREEGVYKAYQNLTVQDKNSQARSAAKLNHYKNSPEYMEFVRTAGHPNASDEEAEIAFQNLLDSQADQEIGFDAQERELILQSTGPRLETLRRIGIIHL